MEAYLNTYPRRTPFSWGSGGGCHWTIMDWFVRPLATIFFGGALGGSSLSINLIRTIRETNGYFSPDIHASVLLMSSFLHISVAWTHTAEAGATARRSSDHVCDRRSETQLLISHVSSCDQFSYIITGMIELTLGGLISQK